MELAPGWFFDNIVLTYYIPTVVYLFLNFFHWEALAGVFFLAIAAFFYSPAEPIQHLKEFEYSNQKNGERIYKPVLQVRFQYNSI